MLPWTDGLSRAKDFAAILGSCWFTQFVVHSFSIILRWFKLELGWEHKHLGVSNHVLTLSLLQLTSLLVFEIVNLGVEEELLILRPIVWQLSLLVDEGVKPVQRSRVNHFALFVAPTHQLILQFWVMLKAWQAQSVHISINWRLVKLSLCLLHVGLARAGLNGQAWLGLALMGSYGAYCRYFVVGYSRGNCLVDLDC